MIFRRTLLSVDVISCPENNIRSQVTLAVHGKSPIRASIATDFPDPDSPTIAKISPLSQVKSTLSTALNIPPAV